MFLACGRGRFWCLPWAVETQSVLGPLPWAAAVVATTTTTFQGKCLLAPDVFVARRGGWLA